MCELDSPQDPTSERTFGRSKNVDAFACLCIENGGRKEASEQTSPCQVKLFVRSADCVLGVEVLRVEPVVHPTEVHADFSYSTRSPPPQCMGDTLSYCRIGASSFSRAVLRQLSPVRDEKLPKLGRAVSKEGAAESCPFHLLPGFTRLDSTCVSGGGEGK